MHVDGGEIGRRRVRFAVDLARTPRARVSGLHVTPAPEAQPLYRPSQVGAAVALAAERLARDARAAAMLFQEETARESPDAAWFEAAGDVVLASAPGRARPDWSILGQLERQASPERHPLPIAHSIVLRCGRPVLLVPAEAQLSASPRIAIAWDGSREAVRATHDALPLLRLAEIDRIVTITAPTVAAG